MKTPKLVKTSGSLIFTVGVVFLRIAALKAARADPMLMCCLLGVMLAAIMDLVMRWFSHHIEPGQSARALADVEPWQRETDRDPGSCFAARYHGRMIHERPPLRRIRPVG